MRAEVHAGHVVPWWQGKYRYTPVLLLLPYVACRACGWMEWNSLRLYFVILCYFDFCCSIILPAIAMAAAVATAVVVAAMAMSESATI